MKSHLMIFASSWALTTFLLALPTLAQVTNPTVDAQFITDQPPGEWLARVFLGAKVQNGAGEVVGDINDLVFDKSGRISTVVLGVGGLLGMGEKDVALPFGSLTFKADKDGARMIVVALTKDTLKLAPAFKATEKTTLDTVKEKAADIGQKAVDKAVELKDQAAKKIDDMQKPAPVKK